jgi:SWIB/MDM2 domain
MTKPKKTTNSKPSASLMKPVQPDDALAVIVGSTPVPRGELKKLWNYTKKNKLQDEKKRTLINADDAPESCLWWQEAGQHVRDDQTRLWACKIGAISSGDCLARQKAYDSVWTFMETC